MKTKLNKDSRNLLIALLLGDGTISNNKKRNSMNGQNMKKKKKIILKICILALKIGIV